MWPSQLWLVGEFTVVDEFRARHGENGMNSDAFLEAPLRAKTGCAGQNFGGCHRRLRSQLPRHALLLNSVAHSAGRLESDAVVLSGWNPGIQRWAEATYGKLIDHPSRRRW